MSRLPVRIRCEACPRTFLWEPSMHRLCDGCLIRKEKLEAKRAKEQAYFADVVKHAEPVSPSIARRLNGGAS